MDGIRSSQQEESTIQPRAAAVRTMVSGGLFSKGWSPVVYQREELRDGRCRSGQREAATVAPAGYFGSLFPYRSVNSTGMDGPEKGCHQRRHNKCW